MVSVAVLFSLAAAYEAKIDELISATPRRKKQTATPASQKPAAAPPPPPKKRAAPEPAADAETPANAETPPPAKKCGRKTKENPKDGVAAAAARATARKGQRQRKPVFDWLACASIFLGGQAAFTAFFVYMVKSAVCKSKLPKRLRYLRADVVKQLLDDADVYKVVARELDKRRKPPIAKFRYAHLTGVTISAMDKLRFASTWTPGHSTLLNDLRKYEHHLEAVWCPLGPVPSHGTTRSEAEQRADGADGADGAERGADDEEDDCAPTEAEVAEAMAGDGPTPRDEEEATAYDLEQQGLRLLAEEFPNASEAERLDKWSGGLQEDGPFLGCNVATVMIVRGSTLGGFCKVLLTKHEVFCDEILVATGERRKGRMAHLFLGLTQLFPKAPRIRLQVAEANTGAIKAYQGYGFRDWKQPARGQFSPNECGPDSNCKFMVASRAALHKAALACSQQKPLDAGMRMWRCAAFPIKGAVLDHVGVVSEEEATSSADPPPLQPEPNAPAAEETAEEAETTLPSMEGCPEGWAEDIMAEPTDAEEDVTPVGGSGVKPSWGVKSVVNAIAMMLTGATTHDPTDSPCRCHRDSMCDSPCRVPPLAAEGTGNVELPDSKHFGRCSARRPIFKPTCDAANLTNAPKGRRGVTTVILQLLAYSCATGTATTKFAGLVRGMVQRPQSCVRAFVLRVWFGKDDTANVPRAPSNPAPTRRELTHLHRAQVKAHVAPIMNECLQIEEQGIEFDAPRQLPPWDYQRRPQPTGGELPGELPDGKPPPRPAGHLNRRPLADLPGTKKNEGRGIVREVLVTGIKYLPLFLFCFDGATLLAACNVSLRSNHADPFSSEASDDMGSFHTIGVMRKGETLCDVAERLVPGSSNPGSRDHWLLLYLCGINRYADNVELQECTREPERQDEEEFTGGIGRLGRKARTVLNDRDQSDGRTDTRPPYKDPTVEASGYDHEGFVPAVNGDEPGACSWRAPADCLIRVPVFPAHYGRELPEAVWATSFDEAGQRSVAVLKLCGLCIIHCGMRTAESCLKLMLQHASTRYLAGKNGDRAVIDRHLNDVVKAELRISKRLISVNQEGKLNKVTLAGGDVRILIDDLLSDDSVLLKAIRTMYASLKDPPDDTITKVSEWAGVLKHWALAMDAAYVLRAGARHRQTFRENVRFYVMKKSKIRAGICTWYDWQMYSIFTDLFDTFESLMAISQEGMEACQKQNNLFMRCCNNFANAGRRKWSVVQQGPAAVREYLLQRKKKMKTPEQWLMLRNLTAYTARHSGPFERVEQYKCAGRNAPWTTAFSPAWDSFWCVSTIYRKLRGGWKVSEAVPCPRRQVTWRRREPRLERSIDIDMTRCHFRVDIKTVHGENLADELAAYYAPVPCEDHFVSDLENHARRKEIQRARRKRWAKRARAEWWVPHPEPKYPEDRRLGGD